MALRGWQSEQLDIPPLDTKAPEDWRSPKAAATTEARSANARRIARASANLVRLPDAVVVRNAAMVLTVNVLPLALEVWHFAVAGLALLLSVLASGHAVLRKRDSRAAIAWFGFVWLVPLLGAVLYFIFGVNRIRRQAAVL